MSSKELIGQIEALAKVNTAYEGQLLELGKGWTAADATTTSFRSPATWPASAAQGARRRSVAGVDLRKSLSLACDEIYRIRSACRLGFVVGGAGHSPSSARSGPPGVYPDKAAP